MLGGSGVASAAWGGGAEIVEVHVAAWGGEVELARGRSMKCKSSCVSLFWL